MNYLRKLKTLYNIVRIRLIEKSFGGAKYVYYNNNKDSLLICFSAFPPTNMRLYNNIRGFSDLNVDRLYIADTWGYRGSYYLYEGGEDIPHQKTCALIENIIDKGQYKNVYTAGTSKGGSAAIIYGLKYNASDIFAGACQYRIGKWLSSPLHNSIIDGMRGEIEREEFVEMMNKYMENVISQNKNSTSTIHIVYSKKENTYDIHIKYLIEELKKNNINVVEKECFFEVHNAVGYDFIPYLTGWFNEKQR